MERESERRAEEVWLREAVRRLREALDLERVILFGSMARGTQTRTSDIDLLVVARTEDPPLERIGRVLRLLADAPRPVEVLVLTPEELQRRRDQPLLRTALREGRSLYERRAA